MKTEKIRVLSIRQPYADEIVYGDKWAELRSRATPYRGPVYIHASRWDGPKDQGSPGTGMIGAIIGRVQLVDCVPYDEIEPVEDQILRKKDCADWLKPMAEFLKKFPDESWRHGIAEWNWIFVEPVALKKPIPCLGKLNLWNAEFSAAQLACEQLAKTYSGPLAIDYPNINPPAVEYIPVTSPPGRISSRVFQLLRRKKAKGVELTSEILDEFSDKHNTTVSNILNTLKSHPEFERVPETPEKENWWRIRQRPLEIHRKSRSRKS